MIVESGIALPDSASMIVGTLLIAVLIHLALRATTYVKLWRRWR